MTDKLLYELDEAGIAVLTLNQPEARNPITDQDFIDRFCEVCEHMQHDPAVRVAILTGAGSAFSSGGNVKRMAEAGEDRRTNPIGTRGDSSRGCRSGWCGGPRPPRPSASRCRRRKRRCRRR